MGTKIITELDFTGDAVLVAEDKANEFRVESVAGLQLTYKRWQEQGFT